jgi:hypothetical protein
VEQVCDFVGQPILAAADFEAGHHHPDILPERVRQHERAKRRENEKKLPYPGSSCSEPIHSEPHSGTQMRDADSLLMLFP